MVPILNNHQPEAYISVETLAVGEPWYGWSMGWAYMGTETLGLQRHRHGEVCVVKGLGFRGVMGSNPVASQFQNEKHHVELKLGSL